MRGEVGQERKRERRKWAKIEGRQERHREREMKGRDPEMEEESRHSAVKAEGRRQKVSPDCSWAHPAVEDQCAEYV